MMRRRVLIVEDERLLGEALFEFLSDDHDVELATTVAAAVKLLRADGSFEVILCDVQLPDGSAAEIFDDYCKQWPERSQRFVFLSGGSDDRAVRSLLTSGRNRVLRKPFDLDTLPALIEAQALLGLG
jgi:two-component system, NtrC family, response regulator HydG